MLVTKVCDWQGRYLPLRCLREHGLADPRVSAQWYQLWNCERMNSVALVVFDQSHRRRLAEACMGKMMAGLGIQKSLRACRIRCEGWKEDLGQAGVFRLK